MSIRDSNEENHSGDQDIDGIKLMKWECVLRTQDRVQNREK
jgi:hypothetical protein